MLFHLTTLILCFAVPGIQADEFLPAHSSRAFTICYNEHGCFTTASPFGGTAERPFSMLPLKPNKIGTKFYLYTRGNPKSRQEISRSTNLGVWNPKKPTKFIVHGFLDSTDNKQRWLDMKNAILEVDDVNVILIDWSKGNGFPYTQATANTQVVGAEVALLIKHMMQKYRSKASDFHVIGHSLGAHIAGYVGQGVPGLGRISALDPAGPYFENTDPSVRLDPTDALFVDVLHTDGSPNLLAGLGTLQRMGHVDFYPNGGYNQPKCPNVAGKFLTLMNQIGITNIEGLSADITCSHIAAVHFYTDAIRHACPYIGFSCSNFDEFNAGRCSLQCDADDVQCNRMGYWASPSRGKGELYLKTQDANAFPFCINHYQVTLESGTENKKTRGVVTLKLIGTRATVEVNFDDGATTFAGGSVETRFVPLTVDIGEVQSIEIDFKKKANLATTLLYSPTWSFTKATIFNADNQDSRNFCSIDSIGTPDSVLRYSAC